MKSGLENGNSGCQAKVTGLILGYFPIQKMQVTDVSTLSEDWATNSQHD